MPTFQYAKRETQKIFKFYVLSFQFYFVIKSRNDIPIYVVETELR